MSVKIGASGASLAAREGRETFLRYIDMLEEIGWDSVWFSDRIVGPAWRMDPMAGMAIQTLYNIVDMVFVGRLGGTRWRR